MDQQTDEILVSESRNGNMTAFRTLVERHESKVAGVIKSMLGDTAEAVDVGQEVFIRFYEALDKFRGESAVGTYLIRIAINLSLNEIKSRKRRRLFFMPLEDGLSVKDSEDQADIKDIIHYEIHRLDVDFQSVVTLRMIEGYSTVETADILDIPLGTVLSRLSRAQKKLKEAITKHYES